MKKTSTIFRATAIVLFPALYTILLPPSSFAADIDCSDTNIPDAVRNAAGCQQKAELSNVIINIINTVIGVLGVVAVAFIVVGGVQYMTAAGDPSKTKRAKDTILYACIGLIICALAFAITNFVINTVNDA